jgi:hypothetical protein
MKYYTNAELWKEKVPLLNISRIVGIFGLLFMKSTV